VGSTTADSKQTTTPAASALSGVREPDPGKLLPWLPCTLALEVSVLGFTVGSLLKLAEGTLVQTSCHQSMDIPLHVNGLLMAWTEFEVVGERLAARITDLV
jgi:flagellar motor switch/type III secretory pathway protein FliN